MPDRWQEMYAAKLESRVRVLEEQERELRQSLEDERQKSSRYAHEITALRHKLSEVAREER